jgi:DNA polymerase sigma
MEWYRNRSVVNGGYPMVLVYGEYEKVEEKKEEKTKKRAKEEEEEKAAKPPAELQAQTDEEWGLLYNAM